MSMSQDIAIALDRAERERIPLPPLSEMYPTLTPTESYAIQKRSLAFRYSKVKSFCQALCAALPPSLLETPSSPPSLK